MMKWLTGIRGTILLVLMWTVGWGLGFGGLAELLVDPDGKTLDIWPAEMAIPGFIGGIIFAALVLIAQDRRRPDDVSFVRFTLWGAVSGLVLAGLSIVTDGPIPLDLTAAEMAGLGVALAAVAGLGSAVFFRLVTQGPTLGLAGKTG